MTVTRRRGLGGRPVADYRHSPHLAQWPLHDRLAAFVGETVAGLMGDRPAAVLELGAGHGGFTELLLAAGCDVTAVDMARAPVDRLAARHGGNARLTAVHDRRLALRDAPGPYALVLAVSVLHHVPDYLALLRTLAGRVAAGGALVTLQDPLWYPRAGRATRAFDRSAYIAWRLRQGRVRQGVAAVARRARGAYPPDREDEIAYHHVVRRGVDEEAVAALLEERFAHVELVAYWSHHLAAVARPAEAAGLVNTFAARAAGRRA